MPSIIIAVAAVGAAASMYSSSQQANAAKDAGQLQSQAAQQAAAQQWAMFQQMQGNLSPYMATGGNAMNNLAMLTGNAPMLSPEVQQWQQQLAQAQQAYSAMGGTPVGGGGMTPGMQAAMAYDPNSSGSNSILNGFTGFANDPLVGGPVDDILGIGNRSPIGDIYGALQENPNATISDQSWAEAGFGPGGAALPGSTSGASAVVGGNALTPGGMPVAGAPIGTQVAAGGATGSPTSMPTDKAGLEKYIADMQAKIAQAKFNAPAGNPLTAPLTAPFQPTMTQLEATPGYQFTLNQGLRATQNSATAMGLGQSGPAIAAAGDYAAGLASQTYQQNFQNYWSNNQNLYNMVAGLATMGQNAAAGVGTAGIQTAGAAGNWLTGGAAALGAGGLGAANAWAGGIGAASGAASNAAMLYAMQRNGLYGSNPSYGALSTPVGPSNDASLYGASGYSNVG